METVGTQTFQNPLIKEYTLIHKFVLGILF